LVIKQTITDVIQADFIHQ